MAQKSTPIVVTDNSIARKVNQFARLNDEKKAIEKKLEALKSEFKTFGDRIKEGTFVLLTSTTVQIPVRKKRIETLDKKAVISELGQDWVDAHTKKTDFYEVSSPQRREQV